MPDLDLQMKLSLEKENGGKEREDSTPHISKSDEELKEKILRFIKRSLPQPSDGKDNKNNNEENSDGDTELDSLQKSICGRVLSICRGNLPSVATILGAPVPPVERFVRTRGLSPSVTAPCAPERKNKKKFPRDWLRNIHENKHQPTFEPCNHGAEMCNDNICSCVRQHLFCTKHCAWGLSGRNLFRGCRCSRGHCSTGVCPCFKANRECDPDLCTECDTCSDPAGEPAVAQRCRNDVVGMRRRATTLLVARSEAGDGDGRAGWGAYCKEALGKGDYVGEYIGEVVTQDEAEVRGKICDRMDQSYLFDITTEHAVDVSRLGNKTKFINNSDTPNCVSKILFVNGDSRIGLFAKFNIEAQAELFFDYRYDKVDDDKRKYKPAYAFDWANGCDSK